MSSLMPNDESKRAKQVCQRCHQRKIKCDIHIERGHVTPCTKCRETRSECLLRSSKRGRFRSLGRTRPESASFLESRGLQEDCLFTTSGATGIEHPQQSIAFRSPLASRTQSSGDGFTILPSVALALDENTATQNHFSQEDNVMCDDNNSHSYLGRSGYLSLFAQERAVKGTITSLILPDISANDLIMSSLLKDVFAEIYRENHFTFTPILDRQSFFANPTFRDSVFLQQALAVLGSRTKPPILPHDDPAIYYQRAKTLFYSGIEPNPLIRIIGIIFLQWWSYGPPNQVSLDSQFLWNGIAIRLAQEIGLYREPTKDHLLKPGETFGLRRRIFWTLFARERVFALCQGRPCLINLEDCDVQRPSVEDFPEDQIASAEIFIHYVQLSEILGRLSRKLSLQNCSVSSRGEFATELMDWVQSLPSHLLLPFDGPRGWNFSRDIHFLHLPYLTAIILLHLSTSMQPFPTASPTAILAASCVARIAQDYLVHGCLHFLTGLTGWFFTIAILALHHGRQLSSLRKAADVEIDVLMLVLKEIAKSWHSAELFYTALEKHLKGDGNSIDHRNVSHDAARDVSKMPSLINLATGDSFNQVDFFPGTSKDTTEIFRIFSSEEATTVVDHSLAMEWANDVPLFLQDLFNEPHSLEHTF